MSPRPFRIPAPIVVDCHHFIFALTLTSEQRKNGQRPSEYDLIRAFGVGYFQWVWEPDILDEYARVVDLLIARHRPGEPTIDKREANRIIRDIKMAGLLAGVDQHHYDAALAAVMDLERPREERDEDDVIYLAAADAADALALLSDDRSLKHIRPPHRGIHVLTLPTAEAGGF